MYSYSQMNWDSVFAGAAEARIRWLVVKTALGTFDFVTCR